MSSKNMEDFDRGVALILARLYEGFPQEIVLTIQELEAEADEATRKNYTATAERLAEWDYIRYNSDAGDDAYHVFLGARLTQRGLAILRKQPESLKEKTPLSESFGDSLKLLLKEGSKEAVKAAVKQIVSMGAGYLNSPV